MLGAMTAFACYDLKTSRRLALTFWSTARKRRLIALLRRRWRPSRWKASSTNWPRRSASIPRIPHQERCQGGHQIFVRPGLWSDRDRPDIGGGAEPSANEGAAWQEPGPRRGLRFLVQLRWPDLHRPQYRRRRHGDAAVGTVDVGGSRASLSLVVGGGTRHPLCDKVKTVVADTATLGYNDTTEGSRGTFSSSMATISAARNAVGVMRERAAKIWDIPVDDVVWEDGHAKAKGQGHGNLTPLSLKEIAAGAVNTGGPIAGHSEIVADGAGVSFATHICDVEVDPETGATKVLRYTVIQDAGKAVHPTYVEGQFQGARRAGDRLGAQRGIHLRQGRPPAEPRIPRLPDTGVLGPADDRHPNSRDPKSQSPLWRARGGRDIDRAAARGGRQCGVERDRCAHDAYPHVATPHPRRPRGRKGGR